MRVPTRPSNHHGEIETVIEEFEWRGCLLTLHLTVAFTLEPYDLGYRYDRNGDGCPPSGGGVEDMDVTVDEIELTCDADGDGPYADWQPMAADLDDIRYCLSQSKHHQSQIEDSLVGDYASNIYDGPDDDL